MEIYDAIVIGGGQAGLATGYQLQRAGLRFVILEASSAATGSWRHYYESLKLFSPARYSSLPGMPFPGEADRYPKRDEVVDYLRRYAQEFNLPIIPNTYVESVGRYGSIFRIITREQTVFESRAVVAATGAFSRPHIPAFEGQESITGNLLHSSDYQNPTPFRGQRVLVVGAGNSAVQIAVELANVGRVTLTSREPLKFVPQRILGRDVHFWIRLTGFDTWRRQFTGWRPSLTNQAGVLDTGVYRAAIRSGNPIHQPLFARFTERGVQWIGGEESHFDVVIFATGFRPNYPYLVALNALDEYGNPLHISGISTTTSGLYYVGISGQRSFASATLRGVGDDTAYVSQHLNHYLKPSMGPIEKRCCFNFRLNPSS
jgi:putative flavoprotein involved in K+ transport